MKCVRCWIKDEMEVDAPFVCDGLSLCAECLKDLMEKSKKGVII